MVNAVEHRNLGLGFSQKHELMAAGEWRNEAERLLSQPANAERFACTRVECRPLCGGRDPALKEGLGLRRGDRAS